MITWAGHLSVAMRWVHDNRDLAAVVVEAEGTESELHLACASGSQPRADGAGNRRQRRRKSGSRSRRSRPAQTTTSQSSRSSPTCRTLSAARCSGPRRRPTRRDSRFSGSEGACASAAGQGARRLACGASIPAIRCGQVAVLHAVRAGRSGSSTSTPPGWQRSGAQPRRAVVGSSIYAYLPEEHRDAMSSLIRNARPEHRECQRRIRDGRS